MLTIDGLASGLDTSSIIEGLLSIQKQQLDRLQVRKQEVAFRQTAFQGIEAAMLSLQSAANSLNSPSNNLFSVFEASSSDDDVLAVAASDKAAEGTHRIQVEQLATAAQQGSQTFASSESLVTQGTIEIRVGNRDVATVTIDDSNNTLDGLAAAINTSSDDVSASVINDGSTYRLLLTSRHTGVDNSITITNNTAATSGNETQIDFTGPAVQEAQDAQIRIGSGAGSVLISRDTNLIDDVIEGLTLNLKSASPGQEITINVAQDVDSAASAIEGFVDAFNNVLKYIDSQTGYDQETDRAGLLLGDGSTRNIRDQLQRTLSQLLPNLGGNANRLSTVGITFNERGQLDVDAGKLRDALSGNLDGVSIADVRRLFALDATTTSNGISFVAGTSDTLSPDDPFQVVITQAAQRASVASTTPIDASIVIDGTNDTFSLNVDGVATGDLQLAHGTYTPEELAQLTADVINSSPELNGREVAVTTDGTAFTFTSLAWGDGSQLDSVSGSASKALGFSGTESDQGRDVAGYFIVDGETEQATGTGRILTGKEGNTTTDGLQLQVTLSDSQVVGTYTADVTVTRGFAARLDQVIAGLVDDENGKVKFANDAFEEQIASIEQSATRLNDLFEAKQQQLISQFAAIETQLSSLQNTASFLASQLQTIQPLSR